MTMRDDACSIRSIAKRLFRSPGTVSREIKRQTVASATPTLPISAAKPGACCYGVFRSCIWTAPCSSWFVTSYNCSGRHSE
jgi:hypothetical protein